MRLGIIANTGKPKVPDVIRDLASWLDDQSIEFWLADDLEPIVNLPGVNYLSVSEIAPNADFVLSLGGDGTFLQTARHIAQFAKPIVGVNLGGFGYLAEVTLTDLYDRINDLKEGRFLIEERMMLSVESESISGHHLALNDVVLDKGGFTRTIRLETSVDDEYLNTFMADGLIVATSTGSTGYSLSAGGPILEPALDGLIINPICPHMLANRPLVVCGSRILSITAFSEFGLVQLAVDGRQVLEIPSGGKVTIRRSDCKTRIVHFPDSSFFALLRTKLQWRK